MFRLSFPQRIAALGLAAALTVSWVSAAPASRRVPASPVGFIQQLLILWAELRDEGCHLDPSGGCASVDAGCHLDPNGRCASVDAGCHADPDGRCATVDAGCHADPSGGCAGGSW